MSDRLIPIRNPGATDGVIARMRNTLIEFLREDDEEALGFRTRPTWDDLRFPFTGSGLDSAATRYSFDYDECGVSFHDDARYPEEAICSAAQLQHDWSQGTNLHPHLHWIQAQDKDPNWLMRWRLTEQNSAPGSWTNAIPETKRKFTYVSGSLMQITEWPQINLAAYASVSIFIDVIIYRDTANASTLFAGADPYTAAALAKEFDFHYQRDALGSFTEYVK